MGLHAPGGQCPAAPSRGTLPFLVPGARRLVLGWLLAAPWLALGALALGSTSDRPALLWISVLGWLGFLFHQYLASGLYGAPARLSLRHLAACLAPPLLAWLSIEPRSGPEAWRGWCLAAGLTELLGFCGAACLLPWHRHRGVSLWLLWASSVPLLLTLGWLATAGQAWRHPGPHAAWLAVGVTVAILLRRQAWLAQRDSGALHSPLDSARWLLAIQLTVWILPGVILAT